jgi:hypothetical protein
MTYDNTNRGVIFRNDKRRDDRDPDHTGSIDINGVGFWLSGWLKTSKSGVQFLSLSVRPKEPARPVRTYSTRRDDFGEDPADFLKS